MHESDMDETEILQALCNGSVLHPYLRIQLNIKGNDLTKRAWGRL
jgi:hypothetical protein